MTTKPVLQLDHNGYFIGSTVADESPLQPGVFLLPARCVDANAPSVPSGKLAKWNGTGFDLEDVHDIPAYVPTLEELKAMKNIDINAARLAANQGTFDHSGKTFACDMLSRGDIDGVNGEVALTGALPATFPGAWKAIDNTYFAIPDVPAWTSFYKSMVAQGATNFLHAQTLKTQLSAAVTAEQVAAIVW